VRIFNPLICLLMTSTRKQGAGNYHWSPILSEAPNWCVCEPLLLFLFVIVVIVLFLFASGGRHLFGGRARAPVSHRRTKRRTRRPNLRPRSLPSRSSAPRRVAFLTGHRSARELSLDAICPSWRPIWANPLALTSANWLGGFHWRRALVRTMYAPRATPKHTHSRHATSEPQSNL